MWPHQSTCGSHSHNKKVAINLPVWLTEWRGARLAPPGATPDPGWVRATAHCGLMLGEKHIYLLTRSAAFARARTRHRKYFARCLRHPVWLKLLLDWWLHVHKSTFFPFLLINTKALRAKQTKKRHKKCTLYTAIEVLILSSNICLFYSCARYCSARWSLFTHSILTIVEQEAAPVGRASGSRLSHSKARGSVTQASINAIRL